MRELLRLSGAYRCPLRDDKGERVCGLLLPCLRTRLRFPQGESLKFSVSVGTMFSAVAHLQGIVRMVTSCFTKFRIRRSLIAPDLENPSFRSETDVFNFRTAYFARQCYGLDRVHGDL